MIVRMYHALCFGSMAVTCGGETYQLAPRFEVRTHSVTGYSWGRPSPGAHQLALAILLDHFQSQGYAAHGIDQLKPNKDGSDFHIMNAVDEHAIKRACDLYQRFVVDVIAKQDRNAPFELTSDQIERWVKSTELENAHEQRR